MDFSTYIKIIKLDSSERVYMKEFCAGCYQPIKDCTICYYDSIYPPVTSLDQRMYAPYCHECKPYYDAYPIYHIAQGVFGII